MYISGGAGVFPSTVLLMVRVAPKMLAHRQRNSFGDLGNSPTTKTSACNHDDSLRMGFISHVK